MKSKDKKIIGQQTNDLFLALTLLICNQTFFICKNILKKMKVIFTTLVLIVIGCLLINRFIKKILKEKPTVLAIAIV